MKRFRSVLALSIQIAVIAALMPLAALAAPGATTPQPSAQAKRATPSGEQVYTKWCAECHATVIGPGTRSLERKYHGQVSAILQKRAGIPAALVEHTVRHGVSFMPPFRKTEISDAQLASLATYLASVDPDSANKQGGTAK
jgi:mono/diheme cytochrome c family protein